jgi:hypothetical protein
LLLLLLLPLLLPPKLPLTLTTKDVWRQEKIHKQNIRFSTDSGVVTYAFLQLLDDEVAHYFKHFSGRQWEFFRV